MRLIKRPRYSRDVRKHACDLYLSGKSIGQISKAIGASPTPIFFWLGQAGIRRTRQEAALIRNEGHPMSWGPINPERAWVLGLIFGDGGITKDGYRLTLSLAEKDEDIALKVMAILKHWTKLGRRQGQVVLSISSRKFIDTLNSQFGLDSLKCGRMRWPSLEPTLLPHFFRGLIDSDGCWHQRQGTQSRQLIFSYSSISHEFVREMENYLRANMPVSRRKVETKISKPSMIRGREIVSSARSVLCYSHLDCIAIGNAVYPPGTEHMRGERKYLYWLERSDAYIKPQWILRHERQREKSRLTGPPSP